jgi:hypothetical protein
LIFILSLMGGLRAVVTAVILLDVTYIVLVLTNSIPNDIDRFTRSPLVWFGLLLIFAAAFAWELHRESRGTPTVRS